MRNQAACRERLDKVVADRIKHADDIIRKVNALRATIANWDNALLSQGQIIKLIGSTVSQFQYFVKIGLIIPKYTVRGRGHECLYDKDACNRAAIIQELYNAGFRLNVIKAIVGESLKHRL